MRNEVGHLICFMEPFQSFLAIEIEHCHKKLRRRARLSLTRLKARHPPLARGGPLCRSGPRGELVGEGASDLG